MDERVKTYQEYWKLFYSNLEQGTKSCAVCNGNYKITVNQVNLCVRCHRAHKKMKANGVYFKHYPQEAIRSLLNLHGVLTVQQLCDFTGLSTVEVNYYLVDLGIKLDELVDHSDRDQIIYDFLNDPENLFNYSKEVLANKLDLTYRGLITLLHKNGISLRDMRIQFEKSKKGMAYIDSLLVKYQFDLDEITKHTNLPRRIFYRRMYNDEV